MELEASPIADSGGHKFDPSLAQYLFWRLITVVLLFPLIQEVNGCYQFQVKVCARITSEPLRLSLPC